MSLAVVCLRAGLAIRGSLTVVQLSYLPTKPARSDRLVAPLWTRRKPAVSVYSARYSQATGDK